MSERIPNIEVLTNARIPSMFTHSADSGTSTVWHTGQFPRIFCTASWLSAKEDRDVPLLRSEDV